MPPKGWKKPGTEDAGQEEQPKEASAPEVKQQEAAPTPAPAPAFPKGKPVIQVQFHNGVLFHGKGVLTGIHGEAHGFGLELVPVGVLVKRQGQEWLVPFSNVVWVKTA